MYNVLYLLRTIGIVTLVSDDKSIFLRGKGKGKVGLLFCSFKLKSIVFRGTRKRKLGRYISELGNLSLLGTFFTSYYSTVGKHCNLVEQYITLGSENSSRFFCFSLYNGASEVQYTTTKLLDEAFFERKRENWPSLFVFSTCVAEGSGQAGSFVGYVSCASFFLFFFFCKDDLLTIHC